VGIAGTFIGVPIVIAIPTICKQYQSGRWIADLFGGTSNEA
jgi:predicted PurR-regulated permease PerM